MHGSLFSCGTLMFARVRRLHSRRALATEPAVLTGYARRDLARWLRLARFHNAQETSR